MRRPPSLSESYIYDVEYNFIADKLEPLGKTPLQVVSEPVLVLDKPNHCEVITEYFLRFMLHLSLIAFFETLFFFHFVSKDEDRGILATTNFYTDSVLASCSNLTSQESQFINMFLDRFINSTSILQKSSLAGESRLLFNSRLNNYSWVYFAGLTAVFVGLVAFSCFQRYKMRWFFIIGENIVFVSMLGFYELMFFETIVKNYATLSPDEISGMFVGGLQKKCHLMV